LTQFISSPTAIVSYGIVNADKPPGGVNTPGRINLNPPSTNGGVSTINGEINAQAVPEPSTIATSLGAVALLGLVYRSRRKPLGAAA